MNAKMNYQTRSYKLYCDTRQFGTYWAIQRIYTHTQSVWMRAVSGIGGRIEYSENLQQFPFQIKSSHILASQICSGNVSVCSWKINTISNRPANQTHKHTFLYFDFLREFGVQFKFILVFAWIVNCKMSIQCEKMFVWKQTNNSNWYWIN